jgi:hypothetical protein
MTRPAGIDPERGEDHGAGKHLVHTSPHNFLKEHKVLLR